MWLFKNLNGYRCQIKPKISDEKKKEKRKRLRDLHKRLIFK